jgi:hypothetical protein
VSRPETSTIDFVAVADRADLRALVVADLGPPDRSRKWCCPFHDDRRPSLGISPDGRRFRCWSGRCGATGTALDWLMLRDGLSVVEAARLLDPTLDAGHADRLRTSSRPKPPARPPAPPPAWQVPAWQATISELVDLAERNLWGSAGRDALTWLRARGLEDHTIRRFRLGFLDVEGWTRPVPWPDGTVAGLRHKRGVVLPWLAPGAWYTATGDVPDGPRWCGCNIRRLMPDVFEPLPDDEDKCRALRGSERGHLYPHPDVLPTQGFSPALLLEGEFDALLAHQETGGSPWPGPSAARRRRPGPRPCPPWRGARGGCWVSTTTKPASRPSGPGASGAPHKAKRVLLPHGKDVSDFHMAGGDVAGGSAANWPDWGSPTLHLS